MGGRSRTRAATPYLDVQLAVAIILLKSRDRTEQESTPIARRQNFRSHQLIQSIPDLYDVLSRAAIAVIKTDWNFWEIDLFSRLNIVESVTYPTRPQHFHSPTVPEKSGFRT